MEVLQGKMKKNYRHNLPYQGTIMLKETSMLVINYGIDWQKTTYDTLNASNIKIY